MGFVITLFKWILNLLESAKKSILSVWGMVTSFLASLGAVVSSALELVHSANQSFCNWLDSLSSSVQAFMSSIPDFGGWGHMLSYVFALDVLQDWLFDTFFSFLLGHVVVLVSVLLSVIVISFVPLAIVAVRHFISILSAGFIHP